MYDELTEVPDYLKHRNKHCLVRKSELEKRFSDSASLDEFLTIVGHDIQRLIQQTETTTVTGECEDVTFTSNSVVSESVECEDRKKVEKSEEQPSQQSSDTIILSFDGK